MSYKLKSVSGVNFAGFEEITCNFDENLTYLTGPNGSSKTSAGVNLLWVTLQGYGEKAQNKDTNPIIGQRWMVIGNKSKTAKTSVVLRDTVNNYDIVVKRKITQTGTELSFEGGDGVVLDQKFLNDIFNLFLVSPKRFIQLSPKDQAISLGIDLSLYDKQLKELKENYTLLNRDLKGIGTIIPVQAVEPIDVSALVEEKKRREEYNTIQINNAKLLEDANTALDGLNRDIEETQGFHKELSGVMDVITHSEMVLESTQSFIKPIYLQISTKLDELRGNQLLLAEKVHKGATYLKTIVTPKSLLLITELETQIADASYINVSASKYQDYIKLRDKKAKLEKELESNKNKQDEVSANRIEKIKSFNLPFQDLSIEDDGSLMLQGRYLQDQYWSVGELTMIIPMLIISAMKSSGRECEFPFVYCENFSLLDEENQQKIIEFFKANGIQCVLEVVSVKPTGKPHEIFLKDNVIVSET